jgi:uncharacterized protein (DUF362 family)
MMIKNIREESVVAVIRAKTVEYDKIDFRDLLEQAIAELASAGIALPSKGTVFVKPNLVTPDLATNSITTDPHFISELIRLLIENGVEKVLVGESSASYISSEVSYKSTGMGEAVLKAGGILVNIDDPNERIVIPFANSDILDSISVPRKAYESDCIINFGKLKTHRIGAFTCCVKNYVGFIDQTTRLENHQTRLPKLVSELHLAMPETLCFGDGVIVGEGDGPDISKPRFLGALIASNDPVALDVIGAKLLGITFNELLFPYTAYSDGVGEIDISKIKLLGTRPEEIAIRVERPNEVLYNRFPCNIVLGGLCEGCFAWFIGPALFWQRDGIWEQISHNVGKPTFMLGFNAVDRNFEKHLEEGPYFVIGDCTPPKFQQDPRTIFIPGCCPGPAIPSIVLKACGITEDKGEDKT